MAVAEPSRRLLVQGGLGEFREGVVRLLLLVYRLRQKLNDIALAELLSPRDQRPIAGNRSTRLPTRPTTGPRQGLGVLKLLHDLFALLDQSQDGRANLPLQSRP